MSIRGNSPAPKTPQAADYADLGKLFMRNDGLNRQLDIFKNGFINGAFDWNQRGQPSYTAAAGTALYGPDRWGIYNLGANGNATIAIQTFGLGDATPGSDYFIRVACGGHSAAGDGACLYQPIENVRRFAGKRCVLTGRARRFSGAGSVAASLGQTFGTGGSAGVVKNIGAFTPSTVWAPFQMIVDVPPLTAAQIIGPNHYLNIRLWLSAGSSLNAETGNLGLQTLTVDFSELEFKEILPGFGDQFPGFERVPREIELLRSQRFYEIGTVDVISSGYAAACNCSWAVYFKATKRVQPSMGVTVSSYTNAAGVNLSALDAGAAIFWTASAAAGNVYLVGIWTATAEI
jgi:hypothetical protein